MSHERSKTVTETRTLEEKYVRELERLKRDVDFYRNEQEATNRENTQLKLAQAMRDGNSEWRLQALIGLLVLILSSGLGFYCLSRAGVGSGPVVLLSAVSATLALLFVLYALYVLLFQRGRNLPHLKDFQHYLFRSEVSEWSRKHKSIDASDL